MTHKPKFDPHVCSICNKPIPPRGTWLEGNNAMPVNEGRCCDECNNAVVLPRRLGRLYRLPENRS